MPTVKEPSEAKSLAWICRNWHQPRSQREDPGNEVEFALVKML